MCLSTLPLSVYAIGGQKLLYTPGYFLDQPKFDPGIYRYYHDYELDSAFGVTPSISPYLKSPSAVLDWPGYDSLTFTVKDAGRYVSSWRFYAHGGDRLIGEAAGHPDHQHSYPVTYSFLAGLSGSPSEIDVIPLLEVMRFNLAYGANGGDWKAQPTATDYLWSNSVSIATSATISREGHKFQGWNRKQDGSGLSIAAGASFDSAGTGLGVSNHQESVVLYAQWQVEQYKLKLVFSAGIDKIYYKVNGVTSWTEVSASTEVKVDYGTEWQAYAKPKPGHTHVATSATNPKVGTMGVDGVTFAPVATPSPIKVTYDGNGATAGMMPDSQFTFGRGEVLLANAYVRKCRVAFDVNAIGAVVSPASAEATFGFCGWNSAKDGAGEYSYGDCAVVTNVCGSTGCDVTLYAQWTPGSVMLPEPSLAGATFLGWFADLDGLIKVGGAGDTYTPTRDVTLYAKWRLDKSVIRFVFGAGIARIYYRLGDATAWTPVPSNVDISVAYGTKWSAYALAKPGYVYAATSRDQPVTEVAGAAMSSFAPVARANVITISYSGNGATSGGTTSTKSAYDEPITLTDCGFQRSYRVSFNENYGGSRSESVDAVAKFVGWNTAADGSRLSFDNQATVTNIYDLTGGTVILYAQWILGSVEMPHPAREGYAFAGWYTEKACRFKVGGAGDAYTPTANVTLYAKWTAKTYTVTFQDGYSGPGAVSNAVIRMDQVSFEGSTTPPVPPVHTAYRFKVWSSDGYKKVTDNITVVAEYEPISYRINYKSNYRNGQSEFAKLGAGCHLGESIDVLSVVDLKMNKTGYEFIGWAWSPEALEPAWLAGDRIFWENIAKREEVDDTVNLYAVWKPISYQIRFDPNGGEGEMPNQTLHYDRPALLDRNAFACAGKTFREWKSAKGNRYADEAVVSNLTTTAGETIALLAQWDEARLHFVRFDPNGATNGEMAVQQFMGTETQRLYANEFAKPGYTFAGWATASNETAIACSNRADYAFGEDAPHGSTNTLYAVWATNRYTVVFNVGTNDVYGTIQPMTNCAYDAVLSLPGEGAGYTNFLSQGLLGWSLTPGAGALITNTAVNLAEGDGDCVTLYARWKGIGDLSEAAGLTNAALKKREDSDSSSVKWHPHVTTDPGHELCLMCQDTDSTKTSHGSKTGTWTLYTDVIGSGNLQFAWYYFPRQTTRPRFKVKINGIDGMEEKTLPTTQKPNWDNPVEIPINGSGIHRVEWELKGTINTDKLDDKICLDDITWTPDSAWRPEYEAYRLTYANTKGAAGLSALPATYTVTNETFAFAPLSDVEGFAFDGWSPSNIVKGTTGDITVTARWRPLIEAHTVVFSLGGGTHLGGGALEQQVEHGFAAVPPQVKPPAGKIQAGWDREFANVTEDLTVTARYEPEWYRIDYENTLGLANPNPLRLTAADEIAFAPLADTDKARFDGWSPNGISAGTASNVIVTAKWKERTWLTVAYDLGEHLARTGGGALLQMVEGGSLPVAPTVQPDEGYSFAGWSVPVTNGTDVTISAKLSRPARSRSLALVRSPQSAGASKAASSYALAVVHAPANESETTCVIDGITNYFVSVEAAGGGSVRVLDPAGGVCASTAFWAPSGVVLTVTAQADFGWRFAGWETVAGASRRTVATRTPHVLAVDGPVVLSATFTQLYEVAFDLGDHLLWTGVGALRQLVARGESAEAPGFVVDEGCAFEGWSCSFSNVTADMTVRALVAVSEHRLSLGGESRTCRYGEVVSVTAPFDEVTDGKTNIVCVGWVGTGCVPACGQATQLVFTVTGPGSLAWLCQTNFWVDVSAVGGGSVAVFDFGGGVCPATSFWAPMGSSWTAFAMPNVLWQFERWTPDVAGSGMPCPFIVNGSVDLRAEFSTSHQVPTGCYAVVLGETIEDYWINRVYRLPSCGMAVPSGKRFAGWRASNGRRYDDGMLVFNLANEGEFFLLTPIWE